ncbi:hypothetical protein ES703_31451 [subsurface metagenome]
MLPDKSYRLVCVKGKALFLLPPLLQDFGADNLAGNLVLTKCWLEDENRIAMTKVSQSNETDNFRGAIADKDVIWLNTQFSREAHS